MKVKTKEILSRAIFIVVIILELLPAICIFKLSNASNIRFQITDAIGAYYDDHIDEYKHGDSFFDKKESFYSTVFRWWDWGDKRIVPPDVYEKIKPYIGKSPD